MSHERLPTIRWSEGFQCLILEGPERPFYFEPEKKSDIISLVRLLRSWARKGKTEPDYRPLVSDIYMSRTELIEAFLKSGGSITTAKRKTSLEELGL